MLIIQRINFCFQNTRQSKDYMYLWHVLGLWPKKLDLWKYLKKTNIFDFISTTTLWIDMIFKLWDLIPEQERLSNKKNIDQIGKILNKNDINISRHSLKSWPPRGNTVDLEKENK